MILQKKHSYAHLTGACTGSRGRSSESNLKSRVHWQQMARPLRDQAAGLAI